MNRSISFTSARSAVAVVLAVGGVGLLVSACGGRDANDPSTQQAQYNAYGQQPGQYPQQPGQYPQQPGQYPQQPGQYPQQPGQYPQQQPGYPAPTTQQPAAAPAPSPLALPCSDDMICGTHKCNLQTGRCAFPCTANTDCKSGFSCLGAGGATAICTPGAQ